MDITKSKNNDELCVKVAGRLDSSTAPELEESVKADMESTSKLAFDFSELQYISSAGLRVLLGCQKEMNKKGSMVVRNANESIKEIFDITGFSDILTIE